MDAQKVVDDLRAGKHGKQLTAADEAAAARQVYSGLHGPNFQTDNSADLMARFRAIPERIAADKAREAAKVEQDRRDFENSYKPQPLTVEQERKRDEDAAYQRRWLYALGVDVNRIPSPAGLPEPPPAPVAL